MSSPFAMNDLVHYQQWRARKLAAYPLRLTELFTDIADPANPQASEITRLQTTCQQYNFALYRFTHATGGDKQAVHSLGKQLGLVHLDSNLCADEDGLTALHVTAHHGQHDYIPYTNKSLSWHTDGYYNLPEKQIHAMLLHCAQPAHTGGESWLMDHEIAYILLRDANPAYIHALMHPQALTIPDNVLNGEVIRAASSGAVFSVTAQGQLHMRYSARQRHVHWRDDPLTREAAAFLLEVWQHASPYKLHYTLQAGEGLVCNNILHCRSAFTDSDDPAQKRLLYRGRFYERVKTANTQR